MSDTKAKKSLSNKEKIFRIIVIIILLSAIFCGIAFVYPTVKYYAVTKTISDSLDNVQINYYEYDKQNIIFDDNDKTTIVETDKFTIKLPDSLKKSDDSESYKNENNSLNFLIKDEFIDFEEIFDDTASNEKMKQAIIDEYGFFPKSQYEYYCFMERISDYKPNLLKRDLNNAISTIKLADSILAKDTDIYLYNDSKIEFCIEKTMIERPDGITACFYNISGNVVDNYDKFFEISIFTTSEYSDQNIVYKIINSIEIK